MLHNRCQNGDEKDGSTRRIRAGGFSGIVATIWAAGFPRKMPDRSSDGRPSEDMSELFRKTVNLGI